MPFERIGLGGVITLRADPAVTALGRVKRATASVRASFSKLNVGFAKLGTGLQSATMAALPLAYGLMRGAKVAAGFEHQMGAVASITGATGERFDTLRDKAKEMGIVSAFSAQQSGQAMEYMARAGATDAQIIEGLSGVMNAAAADGMDLASAASIVATVTKSMGKSWSEATDIADILAHTSARTNTNITLLGESFVYGAAAARDMGMTLSDTAATFGALSDAGLKGSLAGTAFTNMISKLSRPSAKAEKILKKWGIRLTDAEGKLRRIPDLIKDFSKHMGRNRDAIEKSGLAAELFGARGRRAFAALTAAKPGELAKLFDLIGDSAGKAAEMAERRLSTLLGRITLFVSSVQGVFIELFEPLLAPWANAFKIVTDSVNNVLMSVLELKKAVGKGVVAELEAEVAILVNYGETALAVARGFMDAIVWMKAGWASLTERVREAADWLRKELGTEGLRKLTAVVIKVGMLAAAFVPVAAVLGGVVFVLKRALWPVLTGVIGSMWGLFAATAKLALGPMVWLGKSMTRVAVKAGRFRMIPMLKVMWFWMRKSGTGITGKFIPALLGIGRALKVVLAVGGPLFLVFGLLVSYIASIKREGEGMGDTLRRVFGGIVSTVGGFVRGFISEFGRIWSAVKRVVSAIGRMFDELFGWLWSDSKKTAGAVSGDAYSMGASFADVIEGIVTGLARMFETARGIFHEMSNFFFETAKFMDIQWAKGLRAKGIITQKEYEKELRMAAGAGRMRAEEDRKWYAESRKHAERAAEMRRKAAEATKAEAARRPPTKPPKVTVTLPPTPPPEFTVETTLDVDGSAVAKAVTRHTVEVMERSGARAVRWQRRAALEFGAIELSPAKAGGAV